MAEELHKFGDEFFQMDPDPNIISSQKLQERIEKVFHSIYSSLSTSFGPGGAGTFISIYPNSFNTKDGFTIMKNIAFSTKLDQIICDMIMDICTRLNFTVGDGTTSAVIATSTVYNEYRHGGYHEAFKNILPRHILSAMDDLKNEALEMIDKLTVKLPMDDPEKLADMIRKVVYVSSNGNMEITNMISNMYKILQYPAITAVLSKDGEMKASIVNGYKSEVALTDKMYINNDNNSLTLSGTDVLIFDHRVTIETYENILKPLVVECTRRQRKLLCIAPFYDETALSGTIAKDLSTEYRKTKDISLVLATASNKGGNDKQIMSDMAMLFNTELINQTMEKELIDKSKSIKDSINEVFNIDNRDIPNLSVAIKMTPTDLALGKYSDDMDKITKSNIYLRELKDSTFRVGYFVSADIGVKESVFSGFYYNEDLYKKTVDVANRDLEEIRKKCEKMAVFSNDLINKQRRAFALRLKMGIIEVGASSEISQGYLKDTMDDAVKAAASAFNNGIVLGCNLSLIQIFKELSEKYNDPIMGNCARLLYNGYTAVYKAVLDNVNLSRSDEEAIISDSLKHNVVYDVSSSTFSKDIINSAETDKEILKATIDLLSLLMTAKQIVIR